MLDKLSRAGLIPKRQMAKLATLIDGYIGSRSDAKPNTVKNYKVARKSLVDYFGADRAMRTIKPGEADEWRQSMVNEGLAEARASNAKRPIVGR